MSPPSSPIRIKFAADRSAGFAPATVAAALDDALNHGARIYGIAGLQGSGKSTLAAQMVALARSRGLRAVSLSLDDCYLGRGARLKLARSVHPLLATRGPPGTHDLALACACLDALRAGTTVRLPRFDKLRDRRLPPSRWRTVGPVDLAIFEGWCLKTPAQTATALRRPLNALEHGEDPGAHWRSHCNTALARDYPALWARLDRLLWLQPPGFAPVSAWRWQQERAMRAAHPGATGMSRAEVARFVQHFERVSRQALRTLPQIADAVLPLDSGRSPRGPLRTRRSAPDKASPGRAGSRGVASRRPGKSVPC